MTGTLAIGSARTSARFVGDGSMARGVQGRLAALLTGPVTARVGLLADTLPEAEIICLPKLTIQLRLTLTELHSLDAADQWATQIEQAIEQALADPATQTAQRFGNRQAFHAAYIRHRLGLLPTPEGIFAGFGALDLLSPARAMAEMLAADPRLWAALGAAGPEAAVTLVRAILAQGGDGVLVMILEQASTPPAMVRSPSYRASPASSQTQDCLDLMPAVLAHMRAGVARYWSEMSQPAQVVLCALSLGPSAVAGPVPMAQTIACLLALVRYRAGIEADQLISALVRFAVDQPYWQPQCDALLEVIRQNPGMATHIIALLPGLSALLGAEQTKRGPDHAPSDTAPKSAPQSNATPQYASHFHAPFAGVALVLPHLAEDGIGRAFAASDILAALGHLARSDLYPEPQRNGFLAALSGTLRQNDTGHAIPDRPNTRDLLFIPSASHDRILTAAPGAARLAVWLMSRFAATLPGLGASSLAFLQRQFFHTAGEVWIDEKRITLRLDPVPLQAVLDLAGRAGADLARLDWLMGQSLTIRFEPGRGGQP